VVAYNLDAAAKSINTPLQRICSSTFTPVITLRNRGAQTLTAVTIQASIDNGAVSTTSWTGSLASLQETNVSLNQFTISAEGIHTLNVIITQANGTIDENTANDAITLNFQYNLPLSPPVTQGFESTAFPPAGWDIINDDGGIGWERATGVGKTGNAAAVIRNFDYVANGRRDYLRLPVVSIANVDSAYMTFQVAAAVVSDPKTAGNAFDTLEVLVSRDCGATYTSLYKRTGRTLITDTQLVATSFKPTAAQWRKDSVNLTPYINAGQILLAFANTTEHENNIYLDDINVYSVTINPILKTKGFMITPNPASNWIHVQFFPNAAFVKGINIFNSTGNRVASLLINGSGSTSYGFDMSKYANGVYIVQVVLSDGVITQKVIKR
ncbi:MAG TPA: choice-of-anchor J domain-containing protein, partial [Niastella sp.]|nr:choice-of-anchor J domain-containing protein [Niastella sp.]